jgi:PEP-CTERM motif
MLPMIQSLRTGLVASFLSLSLSAGAASLSESSSGDFSNDRLAPTLFALDAASGGNLLSGRIGRVSGVVDRDYLHIVVPQGFFWTGLLVEPGTDDDGSGGSFVGLASGPVMPVPSNGPTAAGLLGWTLYGASSVGTDLFGAMSIPNNGSSGFTSPLGAGSYTLWIQELASGDFNYNFNLTLAPVPEPSSALLLVLGLTTAAGLGARARRRRDSGRG